MAICKNKKCSIGECDQTEDCAAYVPVISNADRIRAMSDDELAAFINRIVICHHLRNEGNCEKCPIHPAKPCDTDGIVEWLKQPAEGGLTNE